MDRIERLERLSKLLDDGNISTDEYETLKQQVLEEPAPTSEQSDTLPPAQPPPQQEAPERQVTPGLYWAALVLGIASVFLGGTFGLVAWATVAVSAWALYSLKVDFRRWMAWTGVALGVVFSLMNVYLNGHFDSLLGGTDIAWSSNDLTAVVQYCQDNDANASCGNLANALSINECTVSDAYNYLDREARARANGPPPIGAGFMVTRLHTPQGVLGVSAYCETTALFRDS